MAEAAAPGATTAQSKATCQLLPSIVVPRAFIEGCYDVTTLRLGDIAVSLPSLHAAPASAADAGNLVSYSAQLFSSQPDASGECTYYLLGLPVAALSQLQTFETLTWQVTGPNSMSCMPAVEAATTIVPVLTPTATAADLLVASSSADLVEGAPPALAEPQVKTEPGTDAGEIEQGAAPEAKRQRLSDDMQVQQLASLDDGERGVEEQAIPLLIPRQFVESSFDMQALLASGLEIQVVRGDGSSERLHVEVVLLKGEAVNEYCIPDGLSGIIGDEEILEWRKLDGLSAQLLLAKPTDGDEGGEVDDAAMAAADLAALAAGPSAISLGLLPAVQEDEPGGSWQGKPSGLRCAQGGGNTPPGGLSNVYERLGRSCSSVILPGVPGTQLPSPPPGTVQHRSKKQSVTLISAEHFIHIPRHFFQTNYDTPTILQNGLHVQIEANGVVEPDVVLATVANYQNNSGYSYYRLLGFKPICRRYSSWKVDGWQKVDDSTVRLCISGPYEQLPAPAKGGVRKGSNSRAPKRPPAIAFASALARPSPAVPGKLPPYDAGLRVGPPDYELPANGVKPVQSMQAPASAGAGLGPTASGSGSQGRAGSKQYDMNSHRGGQQDIKNMMAGGHPQLVHPMASSMLDSIQQQEQQQQHMRMQQQAQQQQQQAQAEQQMMSAHAQLAMAGGIQGLSGGMQALAGGIQPAQQSQGYVLVSGPQGLMLVPANQVLQQQPQQQVLAQSQGFMQQQQQHSLLQHALAAAGQQQQTLPSALAGLNLPPGATVTVVQGPAGAQDMSQLLAQGGGTIIMASNASQLGGLMQQMQQGQHSNSQQVLLSNSALSQQQHQLLQQLCNQQMGGNKL